MRNAIIEMQQARIASLVAEIAALKSVIQALLPYAEDTCDTGDVTEGEGWKSDTLKGIIADAHAAIGQAVQPEPDDEPTRWCGSCQQHVTRCAGDAQGCPLIFPPRAVQP